MKIIESIKSELKNIIKENPHANRDMFLAFLTVATVIIGVVIVFVGLGEYIIRNEIYYPFFSSKLFGFFLSAHEVVIVAIVSVIVLFLYKKLKISKVYNIMLLHLLLFYIISRLIIFLLNN